MRPVRMRGQTPHPVTAHYSIYARDLGSVRTVTHCGTSSRHLDTWNTVSTRILSSRSSTRALHASLCPGQAASWHFLPQ
jgi:hypothetical protein